VGPFLIGREGRSSGVTEKGYVIHNRYFTLIGAVDYIAPANQKLTKWLVRDSMSLPQFQLWGLEISLPTTNNLRSDSVGYED
jgi:hypothetical protein